MNQLETMRNEVKKYIDTADEKVVKMVHAMLKVDNAADWWDAMPNEIKEEVETSIRQADSDDVLTHEEVKAKYGQWFIR